MMGDWFDRLVLNPINRAFDWLDALLDEIWPPPPDGMA